MKAVKPGKRGCKLLLLGAAFILAIALLGIPAGMAGAQVGPVPAHHYWGQVTTTGGQPASEVEVTAWIDGEFRGSITTDTSGNYGMVSLAYYLAVTGYNGDIIEFRVDGVVAQETRLGIEIEEDDNRYWEWQDLAPAWQAVFDAEETNGLDLVYTPTTPTPEEEDETSPATVTLSISNVTGNSITLSWTAPGDDGSDGKAAQYDIRYLEGVAVTGSNWDTATQASGEPTPKSAGSSESFTVMGLDGSTTYYFAIKTADEILNWSAISNSPSGTTTGEADTTRPAAITDLSTGGATTNSITLSWTAPGDDDDQGKAAEYDIRYLRGSAVTESNWNTATQASGEPTPKSAGSSESFTVTGLSASTTYYFAIKTRDEVPTNLSAISNSPSGTTSATTTAGLTGGGNGGGGVVTTIKVKLPGNISQEAEITPHGRVMEAINISISGVLKFTIAKNTRANTANGDPLKSIIATILTDPPRAPAGKIIISPVLNFTPKGATFDPPILMVLNYDSAIVISKNVDKNSFTIAFYDEETATWTPVASKIDTEAKTVSAYISHFTTFAILATVVAPPPPTPATPSPAPEPVIVSAPPEAEPSEPVEKPATVAAAAPRPASITVTDLVVNPNFIVSGGEADVFVDVTNTGEAEGIYYAELKINGEVEATKSIPVFGGETETIVFSISKDVAGDYIVEIEGKSTTLRVAGMTRWVLIAGIIGGAFVLGLLIFLLRKFVFVRG